MSKQSSIDNLNRGLAMELSAVHQYQLHAAVLADWGLDLLATEMRGEMQEELVHASKFLDRIVFLKGEPKMEFAKTPSRAANLKELFEADLEEEKAAVIFYTKASVEAGEAGDLGTKRLFEDIAIEEEGHMAWLELQLDLLQRMGEGVYIAKYMSSGGAESEPQA